jgi:serine/threonine protein kinase
LKEATRDYSNFKNEVKFLTYLKKKNGDKPHPNIPDVVFAYEHNPTHLVLVPFGIPITDMKLLQKAIPGILNALHFAHTCGVVHRDIRKENMILDPKSEQGVLIDWEFSQQQDNVDSDALLHYKGSVITASDDILDLLISKNLLPIPPKCQVSIIPFHLFHISV